MYQIKQENEMNVSYVFRLTSWQSESFVFSKHERAMIHTGWD